MKSGSLALAKLMVGEQKANAAEKQRKLKFRNHSLNNTRLNNKTTNEEWRGDGKTSRKQQENIH